MIYGLLGLCAVAILGAYARGKNEGKGKENGAFEGSSGLRNDAYNLPDQVGHFHGHDCHGGVTD